MEALLSGSATRRSLKRLALISMALKAPEILISSFPLDLPCQAPTQVITVTCCFCVVLPTSLGKSIHQLAALWIRLPAQWGSPCCLEIPFFPAQVGSVAYFLLWLFSILSAFFEHSVFHCPIMPTANSPPFCFLTPLQSYPSRLHLFFLFHLELMADNKDLSGPLCFLFQPNINDLMCQGSE